MVDSPGGREVGRLSLKVLPDTSDFVPKLEVKIQQIEHSLKVEIPVELDFSEAFDDLRDTIRLMNGYAHLHPVEIDTEIEVAGAIGHLDTALAAMQGTADLNKIHVDVEIDSGAENAKRVLQDVGQKGSAAMTHIGLQIALWGPLIFIAAVGIAAIAPSLAVILPLVVGIAAAAGVMALGWDQVKDVVKPLADDFKTLRKEVGGALTAGLKPFIKELGNSFLPMLSKGLVAFATFVNGAIKGLLKFLNSNTGLELFGQLFAALGPALQPFADLLPKVLEVFLRLTIAALPALQMMGDAILDVTNRFNEFLKKGTASGAITQSMGELGQVLGIIGKLVADVFPSLVAAAPGVIALLSGMGETFGAMFKILKRVFEFMSKHKTTMGAIGAALAVLIVGFGVFAGVMAVVNAVMAVNPFVAVGVALVAVAAGLIYAYKHSEKFRNIVQTTWEVIRFTFDLVVVAITAAVKVLVTVFRVVLGAVIGFVTMLVTGLISGFTSIWTVITTVITAVAAFVTMIVTGLVTGFTTLWSVITAIWNAILVATQVVWAVISGYIRTQIAIVVGVVRGIIGIVGVIGGAFSSAYSTVVSWVGRIVNYVMLLPGRVVSALVGFAKEMIGVGADAMRGLMQGIRSMATALVNAAKGVVQGAINAAKSLLHIGSPSKLFRQFGVWTIEGYQVGLESQAGSLVNSMEHIMGQAADAVSTVFDPNAVNSATSSMSATIGAIVDNTTGPQPQQIFINWETGKGVMADISDQQLAQREFVAAQDNRMGVQQR